MHRDQTYSRETIATKIAALPLEERAAAADGRRCLDCGSRYGAMQPVGYWRGCQVFIHIAGSGACAAIGREIDAA